MGTHSLSHEFIKRGVVVCSSALESCFEYIFFYPVFRFVHVATNSRLKYATLVYTPVYRGGSLALAVVRSTLTRVRFAISNLHSDNV